MPGAPSIIHENGVLRVKELHPFLNVPKDIRGVKSKRMRTLLLEAIEREEEGASEWADQILPRIYRNPDLWGIDQYPETAPECYRGKSRLVLAEVDHTSCFGPIKAHEYGLWAMKLAEFSVLTEVWIFEPSGELCERYDDSDLDFFSMYHPIERAERINDYRSQISSELGLRGPRPGSIRKAA